MSVNKDDILQIEKYVNGELDARAMHELERRAQDDPFFLEALEGYEQTGKVDQIVFDELTDRLEKRTGTKIRRLISWKYYAAAASVLLFLIFGYLFWPGKKAMPKHEITDNITAPADHVAPNEPETTIKPTAKNKQAAVNELVTEVSPRAEIKTPITQPVLSSSPQSFTYKADTVEYRASDYKVRPNPPLNELLKNMEGIGVDSAGAMTIGGNRIAKVKLNGKEFSGGNVTQAIKSLPADILEKAQVVDDYGDQAARPGVKGKNDTTALKEVAAATLNRGRIGAGSAAPPALDNKLNTDNPATPPRAGIMVSGGSINTNKATYVSQPRAGWAAFNAYLNQHAFSQTITGDAVVTVTFSVNKNGRLSSFKIARSAGKALDDQAIKLIKNGPAWAGDLSGRTGTVSVTVTFRRPSEG